MNNAISAKLGDFGKVSSVTSLGAIRHSQWSDYYGYFKFAYNEVSSFTGGSLSGFCRFGIVQADKKTIHVYSASADGFGSHVHTIDITDSSDVSNGSDYYTQAAGDDGTLDTADDVFTYSLYENQIVMVHYGYYNDIEENVVVRIRDNFFHYMESFIANNNLSNSFFSNFAIGNRESCLIFDLSTILDIYNFDYVHTYSEKPFYCYTSSPGVVCRSAFVANSDTSSYRCIFFKSDNFPANSVCDANFITYDDDVIENYVNNPIVHFTQYNEAPFNYASTDDNGRSMTIGFQNIRTWDMQSATDTAVQTNNDPTATGFPSTMAANITISLTTYEVNIYDNNGIYELDLENSDELPVEQSANNLATDFFHNETLNIDKYNTFDNAKLAFVIDGVNDVIKIAYCDVLFAGYRHKYIILTDYNIASNYFKEVIGGPTLLTYTDYLYHYEEFYDEVHDEYFWARVYEDYTGQRYYIFGYTVNFYFSQEVISAFT